MEPGRLVERILAELPEDPVRAAALVDEAGREAVVADANLFGLTPLLSHYLPDRLPLQKNTVLSARFNAARLERLSLETTSLLEAAGACAVLLKGLDIASRLYPEPWLRPASDVDVLVRPGELDLSMQALVRAGWRRAGDPPRSLFEYSKDVAFTGPHGELLELHFGYDADFQARIKIDRFIDRARLARLGDRDVRVLAEEDDLLLQCVHAAHHGFSGVKWLFDLKLVTMARPSSLDALPALAREYRVASAVGMALREAARRVRAPVPSALLRQLPPGRARARVVRRVNELEDLDVALLLNSLLLADGISWGLLQEAAVRPLGRVLVRAGIGPAAKKAVWKMAHRVGMIRRRDVGRWGES